MRRPRRRFLKNLAGLTLATTVGTRTARAQAESDMNNEDRDTLTLFLCGDVMTGRGIDQILPRSVDPRLYEPFIRNARAYVNLAERKNGPLPESVDYSYIWGEALAVLEEYAPAAHIINLETAVTVHDEPWSDKNIHYRMHPDNVPCLTAAGIDCCVLANNHVLDWGHAGLRQTLTTLRDAGIRTAGAGQDETRAAAPAIIEIPGGRILVFAFGHADSGIPAKWRATTDRGGVNLLPDLSAATADNIAGEIGKLRRPGDVVIVSIHWGGNWGYRVPLTHREFARALIDSGRADIVHGHSSHHPRGIEIYHDRLILYGCGDFLNDYEGIEGHDEFRPELTLMYFPRLNRHSGELLQLKLVPLRIARFRLHRASASDTEWLSETLAREGAGLGTGARPHADGSIGIEPLE